MLAPKKVVCTITEKELTRWLLTVIPQTWVFHVNCVLTSWESLMLSRNQMFLSNSFCCILIVIDGKPLKGILSMYWSYTFSPLLFHSFKFKVLCCLLPFIIICLYQIIISVCLMLNDPPAYLWDTTFANLLLLLKTVYKHDVEQDNLFDLNG